MYINSWNIAEHKVSLIDIITVAILLSLAFWALLHLLFGCSVGQINLEIKPSV